MMKQAMVVLGGGIDPEGNLRGPSSCRVKKAAQLFHEGAASFIITSSKWSFQVNFIPPRTIAAAMKEELIKLNVPAEKIFLEEESGDTITNVYFTKKILISNNWNDILVITSPFQVMRAAYLFQKILGKNYTVEYVVAENGLSASELEEQMKVEEKLLAISKKGFENLQDGDDNALEALLLKKHPGFNPTLIKSSLWHAKELSPFHQTKMPESNGSC